MNQHGLDPQADGILLPHLSGPGSPVRQVMAAHFLRDCDDVIEIGGAGLPISRYLTHHPRSVTIIDPKIEAYEADTLNGQPCHVEYIPQKLQAVELEPKPFEYGLVLLGLSLKPFGQRGAVDPRLIRWIDQAKIVIIDYPLKRDRSIEQLPELIGRGTLDELVRIKLHIEDAQLRSSEFSERYFLVLKPAIIQSD